MAASLCDWNSGLNKSVLVKLDHSAIIRIILEIDTIAKTEKNYSLDL